MKDICPACEKETDLELIRTRETIKVHGEPIEVDVEYYKCLSCGEQFEDPGAEKDPLAEAYREYRRRHGMVQPEEIRTFRKRYGLTQQELSTLLGWGGATLSRYENGALQDETHEKMIRLVMEPGNLKTIIERASQALTDEKRIRLIKELQAEEEEAFSFERIYEERFGNYELDEYSGYRKLDLAKLFNAILFFCKEGVLKTKLNKLLFYADFKHFKDYSVSITGARYARVPFGPAPDKFAHYFATLADSDQIHVEEVAFTEEIVGEKFMADKNPDLSLFSDSELKVMLQVKEFFAGYNAKQITDFSHEEKGFRETLNGKLISYVFAEDLKI
jgi:putative zinc finger/helix-turn-helix YgiT family protein